MPSTRTVNLYERLFTDPHPGDGGSRSPGEPQPEASRETLVDTKLEPALAEVSPGQVVQFERLGYFAVDLDDPTDVPPDRRPPRRVGQHPEAATRTADPHGRRGRWSGGYDRAMTVRHGTGAQRRSAAG